MPKIQTTLLSLLLLGGIPAHAAWEVGAGHADEVLDVTSNTAHVAYVQTGSRFELAVVAWQAGLRAQGPGPRRAGSLLYDALALALLTPQPLSPKACSRKPSALLQ